MVFFTCNHCGSSLKKNKVEKHYATQCKNFPSVSCMDCQKDFTGSEYEKHTKCITEDEKYSAKGFVPKPSSNKGEVKQQSWIEVIKSVKESQENIPQSERIILDTIIQHENVPRKKNKFQNFLKSVFNRKYNQVAAENVWQLLEKQQNLSKSTPTATNCTETNGVGENVCDKVSEKNSDPEDVNKLACNVEDSSEIVPGKKEKKGRKKKEKQCDSDILNKSAELVADNDKSDKTTANNKLDYNGEDKSEILPGKKVKKEKKKKHDDSDNLDKSVALVGDDDTTDKNGDQKTANNNGEEGRSEIAPGKKEKKGKKKKEKHSESDNLNKTAESVGEDGTVPCKEEEKVKDENRNESGKENDLEVGSEELENKTVGDVDNVALSKKERKEKRKREKYEATLKEIELQQFSEINPVTEDTSPRKKKKRSKKEEIVLDVPVEDNSDISTKKDRKRGRGEACEIVSEPEGKKLKKGVHENGEPADESTPVENGCRKGKFSWNEVIIQLIQSKGGEMPLKRLRKKVVAEYQNSADSSETQDAIIVKFNKKLMKVPGVTMNKEIVQLVC